MPPRGSTIQAAGNNTFLQFLVPDRLRERITSFFLMTFLGLMALGSLTMEYLADRFGASAQRLQDVL